MDIQGLDYNTSRPQLALPEYGREIQQMVAYAMTIPDRAARQRCAESIVRTMQRISPQMSKEEDSRHKYWDHLAVMSHFKLDIDYPFDIEQAKKIYTKPQRVPYAAAREVNHYGVLLHESFNILKTMPAGKERDELIQRTANIMWRCLREFSSGSADEGRVASDLAQYTDGAVQVDPATLHLAHPPRSKQPVGKKKKRPLCKARAEELAHSAEPQPTFVPARAEQSGALALPSAAESQAKRKDKRSEQKNRTKSF